jgi:phytoene dehydrogenase-like protein
VRAAVALPFVSALLIALLVHPGDQARSATSAECPGEYRWPVKTLSDLDADKVDLHPVNAGVADFWNDKRPTGLKQDRRHAPLETTTYRVKAVLKYARWVDEKPTATKKGGDLDIHLVIAAPANESKTMIVEFPFEDCIAAKPLLKKRMVAARKAFMKKCVGGTPRTQFHDLSGTAIITGVGFYDIPHADGRSRYGVELHPVIRFGSKDCEWLN